MMTSAKRAKVWLAALVVLGVLVAGIGWGWWRWALGPVGVGGARTVRVMVPKGASARAVGRLLQARGVIRSARMFAWQARGATIQPGVYDLSPADPPARLLEHLRHGDIAREKVTFPEGWTLAQIAERLSERKLVDEAAFLDLVTHRGDTLKASFRPPAKLEGYLFPDTYTFPVGATETEIAQQMLGNFDKLVARGKEDAIRRSKYSLGQIVTIASLIEREAEVDRDRALIAGVIYNRLRIGMPLQIDATVQYARGAHTSRLLYKDLDVVSPYNTYKVRGLPPGPIASPGMESIEAALAPQASPYLYYVARADGSHVFGRTLGEHQQNIARVRQARGG